MTEDFKTSNMRISENEMPCAECGEIFTAKFIKTAGHPKKQVLSNLCYGCRAKKRSEIEAAEKLAIEKEIAKRKSSWLRESGLPDKFRQQSFETFVDRGGNTADIRTACLQYADEFPSILPAGYSSLGLFSSGWGVGKSHLACAIGQVVIDKYASNMPSSPVYYVTEPGMLRRIRSTFNRQSEETEDGVYDRLINVPLLIVDDMGKEEVSDPKFVQRAWFSVINGRYENNLPLIVTANLDVDGIRQHLGGSRNEASFDRLFEMMADNFWEVQATSKRRER